MMAAVIGVFSHGGVRVPAYVGAYEEVWHRGIRFSEVVGTSGGAVVAAFIAAGMTPSQMVDLFTTTGNLYETVAVPPFPVWRQLHRLLPTTLTALDRLARRRFADGALRGMAGILPKDPVTRIVRDLGIFGWQGIDEWVRAMLQRYFLTTGLPQQTRSAVTFGDLPVPLTVIATDLTAGSHKIWSTRETTEADVARAVTASCLIPILFQPVVEDGHVYIDGGMLSYATVLLLAHQEGITERPSAILRFVLETQLAPWGVSDDTGLVSLLSRAISIHFAWERHTQVALRIPIPTIRIPVGSVSALNLKIDRQTRTELYEAGRKAAARFFEECTWPP